jgi:hypothetical protein
MLEICYFLTVLQATAMQRLIAYMKRLGIRPVELLRGFDKNVLFDITFANRRTDNTMAIRKRTKEQTMIYKTLHIKLKIE